MSAIGPKRPYLVASDVVRPPYPPKADICSKLRVAGSNPAGVANFFRDLVPEPPVLPCRDSRQMFSLFSNGFQNLPAAPHDTLATRVGILSALTKPGCRVRYSTTQSKEIISENTKVCDDDHTSVTESALLMSGEDGGLLCAKHSS
jgi:hypothetical protein